MTTSPTLVQIVDPPSLGPGHPLYPGFTVVPLSPLTKLITISAQVATSPSGVIPSSLKEQLALCLSRVSICLEAGGAKVQDINRFIYYFVEHAWDADALKLVGEVVGEWLQGHRPASSFLIVKGLSKPEYLCAFEAEAVVRTLDAQSRRPD
jgi:enamine deaminase RidA (YjgF/YER057c/UK114 family)